MHIAVEEGAAEALDRAQAELLRSHATLSRFLPDSELSLLNLDPRPTVPASPLLRRLARAARTAGDRSAGLVDATRLGPLIRAGYGATLAGVPAIDLERALPLAPARAPAAADPRARWRTIEVDDEAGTVSRTPGVLLDSGGIGKGLLADIVAGELTAFASYAVDCAGDIRIGGRSALPRPVVVDDPFGGGPLHELAVVDGAVATSGIGRRSWVREDGSPAHHLIDPGRGEPAFTGIVQATAVAPNALGAEILAKAALLSGPKRAPAWLPHGGVVVLDDGSARVVEPRLALDSVRVLAPAGIAT